MFLLFNASDVDNTAYLRGIHKTSSCTQNYPFKLVFSSYCMYSLLLVITPPGYILSGVHRTRRGRGTERREKNFKKGVTKFNIGDTIHAFKKKLRR